MVFFSIRRIFATLIMMPQNIGANVVSLIHMYEGKSQTAIDFFVCFFQNGLYVHNNTR